MIEIEFVDHRSGRTRTVGPFPFTQITYSDVRVGENGEDFIATHVNGEWMTADDTQMWSDFIIRPHTGCTCDAGGSAGCPVHDEATSKLRRTDHD